MQLDGLYNQESLCFILSQTDRDFDKTSKNGGYIEDHPELQEKCFDDAQQVSTDKRKTLDLERQTRELAASIAKSKKTARGLLDEIEDIINPVTDGQKRKRKRRPAQIRKFFCMPLIRFNTDLGV